MIYLDNAATSWPKPETVYRTMDEYLRQKGANPGRGSHSMAAAAAEVIDETRLLMARLINGEHERVIFTLNCTDALNLALKGLLKPGDHVITDSIGHNSVVRPLKRLEGQGVGVTRLPPSPATGVVSPGDIERAITASTRALVITHVSNVNGVVQPVAEYGSVARRHDLVLLVDAAQSVGHLPIDIEAERIDLLAFSGHKGPFGPTGTGVLYIGNRVELDTIREGGTGTHADLDVQPTEMPYRYETGTPNSVGIAGLGAGLKFIGSEGLDRIRAKEQSLVRHLIEGLGSVHGVTLCLAKDTSRQGPVVSCNLEGFAPAEVGVLLDQAFDIKVRTGLHCASAAHRTFGTFPLGTVRFSPGYFNTEAEIEQVVQAVGKIAGMRLPVQQAAAATPKTL